MSIASRVLHRALEQCLRLAAAVAGPHLLLHKAVDQDLRLSVAAELHLHLLVGQDLLRQIVAAALHLHLFVAIVETDL